MNWFNSLITAFCTAGICFGLLILICPNGKLQKSVRFTVSLCFLLIIISVAGVKITLDNFEIDFNANSSVDISSMETKAAEYTFSLALQNAGIEFEKISVYTDNSSSDSIGFTVVEIYTQCDRQRIINALGGERQGLEVRVINE